MTRISATAAGSVSANSKSCNACPGSTVTERATSGPSVGCGALTNSGAPPRLTPPMGWNSWNSGITVTEQSVKATIDATVTSGMRDAGYRYVNLDAGWAAPERDRHGQLQADPARFPGGMPALARYAHDRGMQFGLYSSPFNQTCGQGPGTASAGHEVTDARTFAAWGVDYLKYDWCRGDADHTDQVRIFSAMRNALRDTGRRILYSINPNSSDDHTAGVDYDWSHTADMTRDTTDVVPVWRPTLPPLGPTDSFLRRTHLGVPDGFAAAGPAAQRSRPGYFKDPDMLVLGLTWSDYFARHLEANRVDAHGHHHHGSDHRGRRARARGDHAAHLPHLPIIERACRSAISRSSDSGHHAVTDRS